MKTPEEYKLEHEPRQEGLAENEMCIREGIVLKIHEGSRFGFEFFCWRSPECVVEMNCFIEHAKGKTCLLDIGASHGIYSMVFTEINKGSTAYAFEPAPEAFNILTHNSENTKIKTFQRALSDGHGILEMHQEWDHYVVGGTADFKVQCFSGDSFCEDYAPVDAIKIDVEGFELKVLKGLYKTIKANHPVIFLELHTERIVSLGDSVQEVLGMLQELGYNAIDSRTSDIISYKEISEIKEGDIRLILK